MEDTDQAIRQSQIKDAAARHRASARGTLTGNAGGRRHINYADMHVALR